MTKKQKDDHCIHYSIDQRLFEFAFSMPRGAIECADVADAVACETTKIVSDKVIKKKGVRADILTVIH